MRTNRDPNDPYGFEPITKQMSDYLGVDYNSEEVRNILLCILRNKKTPSPQEVFSPEGISTEHG